MQMKSKALRIPRAIILDMDGVIADTETIHMASFRRLMDELKISYSEPFLRDFIGYSVEQNIAMLNQKYLSHKPLEIKEGVERCNTHYLKLLKANKIVPNRGLDSLIATCHNCRIELALASSSVWEQINAVLKQLNGQYSPAYKQQFDVIVSGEDVKSKKPAPHIYRLALRKLIRRPQDVIAVEDSKVGVQSAQSAGIYCIALRNVYAKPDDLKSADYLIDSLDEIAAFISAKTHES